MKNSSYLVFPLSGGEYRDGGAIVAVFILIFSATAVLGTLTTSSLQRIHAMRLDTTRARAQAIADAGASRGFAAVAADPDVVQTGGVILAEDFSGGRYEVQVEEIMPGIVVIVSEGAFQGQTVTAAATLAVASVEAETPDTLVGPLGPVMIMAGGNMVLSGGIVANLGNFSAHANGNLTLSGGPSIAASSLSAVGGLTLSGNPTVTMASGSGIMHANGPINLAGTISAESIFSSTSIVGGWGAHWGNPQSPPVNIAPSVTWPAWFGRMPPVQLQPVPNVAEVPLPELDVDAF